MKQRKVGWLVLCALSWLGAIAINPLVNVRRLHICCSGKEGPFLGFLFAISARNSIDPQMAAYRTGLVSRSGKALHLCVVISLCPPL